MTRPQTWGPGNWRDFPKVHLQVVAEPGLGLRTQVFWFPAHWSAARAHLTKHLLRALHPGQPGRNTCTCFAQEDTCEWSLQELKQSNPRHLRNCFSFSLSYFPRQGHQSNASNAILPRMLENFQNQHPQGMEKTPPAYTLFLPKQLGESHIRAPLTEHTHCAERGAVPFWMAALGPTTLPH